MCLYMNESNITLPKSYGINRFVVIILQIPLHNKMQRFFVCVCAWLLWKIILATECYFASHINLLGWKSHISKMCVTKNHFDFHKFRFPQQINHFYFKYDFDIDRIGWLVGRLDWGSTRLFHGQLDYGKISWSFWKLVI